VKFLFIALAGLVALIAMVVLIGYLLPKQHRASRKAIFHRPQEDVYAVIAGPTDWEPRQSEKIAYDIVENRPPNRLVRRIANRDFPFGGSWTFEVIGTGDGTIVRITEDGEIYNPVFRFMSRFFLGYTRTLDDYLTALGRKLGEHTTPTD
jgi:hypothetical protein